MTRTLQEKFRLGLLLFVVVVFFVIAAARLVHLQVVLGDEYEGIVRKQSSGTVTIPPQRGEIYDQHILRRAVQRVAIPLVRLPGTV